MAEGGRYSTLSLTDLLEDFYQTLRDMLPFLLNADHSSNVNVVMTFVQYLHENTFHVFSEDNLFLYRQIRITSNETLLRLREVYSILHICFVELSDFNPRNFRDVETMTAAIKKFLSSLMAELCLTFQEMRQLTSLPQEDIAKYDRFITAVENLSQQYRRTIRETNIRNEPECRITYLKFRCRELADLLRRNLLNPMSTAVLRNNFCLRCVIQDFYDTLVRMKQFVLNERPERTFCDVTHILHVQVEDVFKVFLQYMRSQIGIYSNETYDRFEYIQVVIREVWETMRNFNYHHFSAIREVAVVFKEFLGYILAELSFTFRDMRRLGFLSEKKIAYSDIFLSSIQSVSQEYIGMLRSNDICNEPEFRMNYLMRRLSELNGLMNSYLATPDEDPDSSGEGASQHVIEETTRCFKCKQRATSDEGNNSGQICTICQQNTVDGEILRRLPCMHVYHKTCIDKYLKMNSKCPLCRKDIKEHNPEAQPGDTDHGM